MSFQAGRRPLSEVAALAESGAPAPTPAPEPGAALAGPVTAFPMVGIGESAGVGRLPGHIVTDRVDCTRMGIISTALVGEGGRVYAIATTERPTLKGRP